jgi:hypothetical protein
MLGVQAAQGRVFHAGDEHGPDSAPYIVLSHDFGASLSEFSRSSADRIQAHSGKNRAVFCRGWSSKPARFPALIRRTNR